MPAQFHLSQFLPYRLALIAERVSGRLAVDYGASHNLTVAEWRVLVHLQHSGVVSVRDVQRLTNLVKSRVSRAVTRLEKAGYLEKHSSTDDARLVEIALTQDGRRAIGDLLVDATQTQERLLEGVSEADLAAFNRVIAHLHSVLDVDPKAKPMVYPPAGEPAS